MAGRAEDSDSASTTPPALMGRRRRRVRSVAKVLGLTGGGTLLVGYLSVIVLLPVAALAAHGFGISVHTHGAGPSFWRWTVDSDFSTFWSEVTSSVAVHAIWLSVWLSLAVSAINTVFGVGIAWVLVRDQFPGKRAVESIIDLPFALPTIVVGVVLIFLYGHHSPVHVDLYETWGGLLVALLFVTLPFSVRLVQPVLESLDGHGEAAATTLGASKFQSFRAVVLPSLVPAIMSGFGLSFARAVGEFGAISLINGGLGRLTTGPALIFNLEGDGLGYYGQAAAVSIALLVLCLVMLVASSAFSRRFATRLAR